MTETLTRLEVKASGRMSEIQTHTGTRWEPEYQAFIDGELLDEAFVSSGGRNTPEGIWFSIGTSDYETFSRLAARSYNQLPDEVVELEFDPQFNWAHSLTAIWIKYSDDEQGRPLDFLTFTFIFKPTFEAWKKAYTPSEYYSELSAAIDETHNPVVEMELLDDEGPDRGFVVKFPSASQDELIINEYKRCADCLHELHRRAEHSLLSGIRDTSVVTYFDFPEEVRVPCEQYLLYFVKFLRDLGVEATADIQHEAGRVLFAVTPADKDEALDKIHTALKTYLRLASSPVSGSSVSEDEMAIQSLLANIDHLKSQLRLSYMMVRTQEATIQAQQVTIANQQRVLSGEVLTDSMKNVTPKSKGEEEEAVIDGILSLGQYENKGLKVNLAEVYRRLKRLFKE